MSDGSNRRMLLESTPNGLYCAAGDFYIDPWRRVPRALITHAHSDHARPGMGAYLTASSGVGILKERIGGSSSVKGLEFGQTERIGDVLVSFHPAGHLLGSSQIRVEYKGEVWVVTGDYKTAPDVSCEAFEPVKCHTLITESTFGLPIYKWPEPSSVFSEINTWWLQNQQNGITSVLFAYALGKAQRLLCGIDASIGPIGVHGAVDRMLPYYRAAGRPIPETIKVGKETNQLLKGRGLIIAPGSTQDSPWLKQFAPHSQAFASGWMLVRGKRRWRSLDRGFVISDHVDWSGILKTIELSGAQRVGVTHGYAVPLVRWLKEAKQLDAFELSTRYTSEQETEEGAE